MEDTDNIEHKSPHETNQYNTEDFIEKHHVPNRKKNLG